MPKAGRSRRSTGNAALPRTSLRRLESSALQSIAKHCNESTIYRAAYAFEQSGDWMKITG
jgi:hypothetical protein